MREDAAKAGFDDSWFCEKIGLPPAVRSVPAGQGLRHEALRALDAWEDYDGRIEY